MVEYDHRVDAPAKARVAELDVEPAATESRQRMSEDGELTNPRVALLQLQHERFRARSAPSTSSSDRNGTTSSRSTNVGTDGWAQRRVQNPLGFSSPAPGYSNARVVRSIRAFCSGGSTARHAKLETLLGGGKCVLRRSSLILVSLLLAGCAEEEVAAPEAPVASMDAIYQGPPEISAGGQTRTPNK